jgi:hypothetical protein
MTTATQHRCVCGRLLGISIAATFHIKHREARVLAGGATRVTCSGCKRPTTFSRFESTRR